MSAIPYQPKYQTLDRMWFRIGAISLILGTILFTLLSFIHPHQADPNNNPAVFAEYAADANWLSTHLGQFFANFMILGVATFAIYRSLVDELESVANWARMGMLTAMLAITVFAVDQALDGIAFKRAVDAWASAPGATKDIYFGAAETLRWLEYGLNGMYNIIQGLMVLLFPLGMAFSSVYPKWFGWTGVVAGSLARMVVGIATMSTGFSTLVGTIWVIAVAYFLWKMPGRQG